MGPECEKQEQIEFEVYFPSGKLYVGDYFRVSEDIFIEYDEEENINYVGGQIERTMNYAKENIVFVFRTGEAIGMQKNNENSLCFSREIEISEESWIYRDLRWLMIVDIETIREKIMNTKDKTKRDKLLKEMEDNFLNIEDGHAIVDFKKGIYSIKYKPYTNKLNIDFVSNI